MSQRRHRYGDDAVTKHPIRLNDVYMSFDLLFLTTFTSFPLSKMATHFVFNQAGRNKKVPESKLTLAFKAEKKPTNDILTSVS